MIKRSVSAYSLIVLSHLLVFSLSTSASSVLFGYLSCIVFPSHDFCSCSWPLCLAFCLTLWVYFVIIVLCYYYTLLLYFVVIIINIVIIITSNRLFQVPLHPFNQYELNKGNGRHTRIRVVTNTHWSRKTYRILGQINFRYVAKNYSLHTSVNLLTIQQQTNPLNA